MVNTRQVHLDYHCSEKISDIGTKFDREEFQETIKKANVNSINLFAKCHHSWSYYPSKIGKMHPHLKFDLLGEQIAACKEVGIKTYIYFTVGWSATDAENHPEWCVRNKDGSFLINGQKNEQDEDSIKRKLPNFYWKFLCVNTSYHNLIISQVEELCKLYEVDGFWFDIYQVHRLCYCRKCLASMKSLKIDIKDDLSVESFNAYQMKRHCKDLKNLIRKNIPKADVFFNGTTAIDSSANFRHRMYENNTIQDLEDLPTTWGGYDKLPLQAKYFINAGYSVTAMSGKFHTDWGEFGGFKHPDALKYEAASMIAYGVNCNFGDQLHPNCLIDSSTYENIAYAYDYVQQIESYGIGGKPFSVLGLWRSFDQDCDEGLSKILLEKHMDFDVVNFKEDWSFYRVIIFPTKSKLTEAEVNKAKSFIQKGGSVITLSKSLFNFIEKGVSKDFGIEYIDSPSFDCDYTLVKKELYPIFVKTPFLNYQPAIKVRAIGKSEVLADIYEPYFNRTLKHYCSHQKTPFKDIASGYPAVVKNGNCIFIAHAIDSMYNKYGSRIHRDLFYNCLNIFYENPFVKVDLPSSARINLLHQPKLSRYVLHLLYATPISRGVASVIEDTLTLRDIDVAFGFPEKIQSVHLIPDKLNLEIIELKANSKVTIPEFKTHAALVFNYNKFKP